MVYDNFMKLCEEKGVTPTVASEEAKIGKSLFRYWKQMRIRGEDVPLRKSTIARLMAYFQCTQEAITGDEYRYKSPRPLPDYLAEQVREYDKTYFLIEAYPNRED